MDDPFAYESAVWGDEPSVAGPSKLPTIPPPKVDEPQFDDFDDFGAPAEADPGVGDDDDDFGDFGDFGEVEEGQIAPADFGEPMSFQQGNRINSAQDWEPLRLDPMPSSEELRQQIDKLIAPIFASGSSSNPMSKEPIREIENITQLLSTPSSRSLYNSLIQEPPLIKPPNWVRSKIRRQHLIAMGIPVNLDEVSTAKALPPLLISTRSQSVPPAPASARPGQPRSTTPQPAAPRQKGASQYGQKPELDNAKIQELLNLTEDNLSLLPVSTVDAHLASLRNQTSQTSALLKYLLQVREVLQQDSETYNKLIGELVGEAQRMKTGKSKPGKRGSGMN